MMQFICMAVLSESTSCSLCWLCWSNCDLYINGAVSRIFCVGGLQCTQEKDSTFFSLLAPHTATPPSSLCFPPPTPLQTPGLHSLLPSCSERSRPHQTYACVSEQSPTDPPIAVDGCNEERGLTYDIHAALPCPSSPLGLGNITPRYIRWISPGGENQWIWRHFGSSFPATMPLKGVLKPS